MKYPERAAYLLRLSPRLKAQLEEKASESKRSLNQEICIALERHVRDQYRQI